MDQNKTLVKEYWEEASCGEDLYLLGGLTAESFAKQAEFRYLLEPYINEFAQFSLSNGKKVLEIGVGLGADHQRFAEAGAELYGIDITERAIFFTKQRLSLSKLRSNLQIGDAERMNFVTCFFDIVYSWGVIHHSPDTNQAVNEIWRVLKPGGEARVMIYHTNSFVGYMLWVRYGLLRFRPFVSLEEIYSKYLESPGTKAYTKKQAQKMFSAFSTVSIATVLTHGDLLSSSAGQRHSGVLLAVARKLIPRLLIKKLFPDKGLFMLIKAIK